jgi:5-methyltetrahydrofolate--homocysteine methyltransferase
LTDEVVGEQATDLFADAQKMLKKIISEKKLKAKGIFGLFPANSINDDDIEVSVNQDSSQQENLLSSVAPFGGKGAIFRTLRQQLERREGVADYALADFIAPKESGKQDYMGCFCVSTGFGTAELAAQYEKDLDDYNSIMVKALADRLAEAFAEYLHKEVRTQQWGYASNEDLSNDDLIKESYKGIRPAPGYPACPDHLEKLTIWDILKVKEAIGVELTDSLAMWPAASVSGYYFGNPEARYFGLGKIKEDQVKDFAERKGMSFEEAEKWLAPNIVEGP